VPLQNLSTGKYITKEEIVKTKTAGTNSSHDLKSQNTDVTYMVRKGTFRILEYQMQTMQERCIKPAGQKYHPPIHEDDKNF